MLESLKQFLQHIAVSNIYIYAFVRKNVGKISILLPHDPAFYAFKKVGDGKRIFLDIGANDGISARSFRKLIPNRPILSIEPNPYHKPALERVKNSINDFSYHLMGAGNENDTMELYTPLYKGVPLTNYASLSKDAARKNLDRHMNISNIGQKATFSKDKVEIRHLDELELDPEIIKIDVEGFEDIVISGLLETIRKSQPMIMVEHNPRSYSMILKQLSSLGYSANSYDINLNKFVPFVESEPDLNVFFLSKVYLS